MFECCEKPSVLSIRVCCLKYMREIRFCERAGSLYLVGIRQALSDTPRYRIPASRNSLSAIRLVVSEGVPLLPTNISRFQILFSAFIGQSAHLLSSPVHSEHLRYDGCLLMGCLQADMYIGGH